MKILNVFTSLAVAVFICVSSVAQAQSYTDVYGNYNYKGNLKVADTTFVKRLITGSVTLDSSALAQFNSTCKGILVPRLTTGQMDSIRNPANGLLVYNITTSGFYYFNDSVWINMGASSGPSSGSWKLTGNAGTNSASDFIGTSDSNGLTFKTDNVVFGTVDSQQHFNFYTVIDSNSYTVQTTNNADGFGLNAIFLGNQTAGVGFFVVDAAPLGLNGPLLITGYPNGTNITLLDSGFHIHSLGNLTLQSLLDEQMNINGNLNMNGQLSAQLSSNGSGIAMDSGQMAINTPLINAFYSNILPDSIADSSKVYANIVLDGATYGNNTLSGGAMLSENVLYDAGSSCVGNVLVGVGNTGFLDLGLFSNEMHSASHLDSNYIEGHAEMWGLGKHSAISNFSNNYLRNLESNVSMYGISGESGESVVGDTVIGNNSGIYDLTLMNFDSVSFNVLSGVGINNLIMQNSDLNYCHFSSSGAGFSYSQLFNSRIINDTVDIYRCFFHNITKDFGSETQDWFGIMLLNDIVGIGITSKPTANLQIGDSANPHTFRYVDGNQSVGKVLTCDANGNATWQFVATGASQPDPTFYFTPGTGDTIDVAAYKYNVVDSTGTLSSLTISMPSSPAEGEWVEIKFVQSGISLQYLNGTVANSAPAYIQPADLYIKLVFRSANNTWY